MLKSLSALLFLSCTAHATAPIVTYKNNTQLITITGKNTTNGYSYNLSANKRLRLVTLNWPPYIDESLCNFGWVYQLTVSMLVKNGYGVVVEFYPWARAVREAELGKADILFPEYYIDDSILSENVKNRTRNQLLALSNPIPGGDLSLITLKDSKIDYDGSIDSVKNYTFGTVRSYKNTLEIDQKIANEDIFSIVVNNELQLAKLLTNKRAELIVADLDSLIGNLNKSSLSTMQKKQIADSIVALKPSLEYKSLYYSISKENPDWKIILNSINDEIDLMTENGTLKTYIVEKSNECK